MKEMYGDPLFFEEVPKNVLGSPKTTRYRQPSSAEFSRVQPSSAEFSRVRRSSAEFTPQPNSAELASSNTPGNPGIFVEFAYG